MINIYLFKEKLPRHVHLRKQSIMLLQWQPA